MSAGREFLQTNKKANENQVYEDSEKMVIAFIYNTCTEQCLLKSSTSDINAKEKNCLSHCYDSTQYQFLYKMQSMHKLK
jgi:hypothetical protein